MASREPAVLPNVTHISLIDGYTVYRLSLKLNDQILLMADAIGIDEILRAIVNLLLTNPSVNIARPERN